MTSSETSLSSEAQAETGDFPPFQLCTVIDSKLSSRKKAVQDLKGTGLFAEIVEPKSLADAITILRMKNVDACLIGPNVTKEGLKQFLAKTKIIKKSQKCAFVVVVEANPQVEPELIGSGAHALLSLPFSKQSLAVKVTEAVRAAGGMTPEIEAKVKERLEWLEVQYQREIQQIQKKKIRVVKTELSAISSAVIDFISEGTPENGKILFEVLRNQSDNPSSRILTGESVESIRELVKRLKQQKEDSGRIKEFYGFVDRSIRKWFLEVLELNEFEATLRLRKKLLSFKSH